MEVQENEATSWVTEGRVEGIVASPDLAHPNKFAKFAEERDVSTGVALLQQDTSCSSHENFC